MLIISFLSASLRIVAIGCVVFSLCSMSVQAQSKELQLFSLTEPSGAGLEWVVSETRLCSTRAWSPETQAPPLATTAAVQSAVKARKPKKRWIVTGVSIDAAVCGREFRWYYAVDMYDEADMAAGNPPDTVKQVVLMDGSVVVPRPLKR